MTPQTDIETVEISIEYAKEMIAIGDKALRLAENKEFKEIILEGYFRDEAARLTGLLGDPAMKDLQEEIISDLNGIASLQRYLRRLVRQKEMMEHELELHTQTLDELRAENHED